MTLFSRVNTISNQYQMILTCSLPGPGRRVCTLPQHVRVSLRVSCLQVRPQLSSADKRNPYMKGDSGISLSPSLPGRLSLADKDKLATLSLDFLTYRVGTGYPHRETSPRLTKITHLCAGHTVGLMKGLSPSFTMHVQPRVPTMRGA